MEHSKVKMVLVLLVALVMIGGLTGCVGSSSGLPVLQADGSMLVKGKVKKISVRKGVLEIKPPKGDLVVLRLSPETILKNIKSLTDIKKNNALQVIYRVEGAENNAISIKAIASGSC